VAIASSIAHLEESALANVRVDSGLPTLSQVLAREGAQEFRNLLLKACRTVIGPVSLEACVAAIASTSHLQALECHLRELAGLATGACVLNTGVRLDAQLSPRVLAVGLPDQCHNSLLDLIKRNLPGTDVYQALEPDSVEFIFDAQNLRADQLQNHQLGAKPYQQATSFERYLWHFPRRYRGSGAPGYRP
jgi:hypothetical protein